MHDGNGDSSEGRLSRLLSESYTWVDRLSVDPPGPANSWPEEVVEDLSEQLEVIRNEAERIDRRDSADFNELIARLDGFCQVVREAYGDG